MYKIFTSGKENEKKKNTLFVVKHINLFWKQWLCCSGPATVKFLNIETVEQGNDMMIIKERSTIIVLLSYMESIKKRVNA